MSDTEEILKRARRILDIEARSIIGKIPTLEDSFAHLVRLILGLKGRVVVCGAGKSGIIGEKIAATLSSTGTPAFSLEPLSAVHGDLGMLRPEDLLLAISNSGETDEVLRVVDAARGMSIPVVAFTGDPRSNLAARAALVIDIGVEREACPLGLAPTASTTVTLAIGDALAMALAEERGFSRDDFATLHPGGRLGERLRLQVRHLMRTGDLLPAVREEDTLLDALKEMTDRDRLGVTLVVDGNGLLTGIVTDGDLRRILLREGDRPVLARPVRDFMTRGPILIEEDSLASEAMRIMEIRGITSLAIVDPLGRPAGIIHLHDILGRRKFVL